MSASTAADRLDDARSDAPSDAPGADAVDAGSDARGSIDHDVSAGYTFIEIMVVLLVIAVLIAMVIPAFLDSKGRASDRAAEANLRTAFANAKVLFVVDDSYATVDAAALGAAESSLIFGAGASSGPNHISVYSEPEAVVLAARSTTGRCLVMADMPRTIGTAFRDLGKVNCDAASALPVPVTVPAAVHTVPGGPWAVAW